MTDFTTQDLLAMIGAKQLMIETLQSQLGQIVQKLQGTVECPDPSVHATKAAPDAPALEDSSDGG